MSNTEQQATEVQEQEPALQAGSGCEATVGVGVEAPTTQKATSVDVPGITVTVTDAPAEESETTVYPITKVFLALSEELAAAGHKNPEAWISSIENPAQAATVTTGNAIYLVNRALRLLIGERRDIPVGDRNAALLGIIDSAYTEEWIKSLKIMTIAVMVNFDVGAPGFVAADEFAKEREASEIVAPEDKPQ